MEILCISAKNQSLAVLDWLQDTAEVFSFTKL